MANRVPVGWGSVSGGGEAVQACPRSSECGMSLPDALRSAAVVAPSVERAALSFAAAATSAHAKASEYNDRVWSSPEIRAAGSLLRGAAEQLGEGKGWGLIALQTARQNLEVAVQIIGKMEGWAKGGE